jgi:hypothetical protein
MELAAGWQHGKKVVVSHAQKLRIRDSKKPLLRRFDRTPPGMSFLVALLITRFLREQASIA